MSCLHPSSGLLATNIGLGVVMPNKLLGRTLDRSFSVCTNVGNLTLISLIVVFLRNNNLVRQTGGRSLGLTKRFESPLDLPVRFCLYLGLRFFLSVR